MTEAANQQFSPQNNAKIDFQLSTSVPSIETVFIAGNFNDWQVNDERFRMEKISDGRFHLQANFPNLLSKNIEYKYLLNGWDNVELDQYGCHTSNRTLEIKQRLVKDVVPRWRKDGFEYQSSFLPIGKIITDEFSMPQLGKKRRVSILLPHDYEHSNQHYPVIYLQDGQNLFNDYSPYGTWAVDKRMAVLKELGKGDVIVVAIDHGGVERIQEFIPYENTKFGATDGKQYARFMVETLKPFIDKNYRTLPQRENTGIGGSSLGALISIYAALMYPQVFSKMMIFSPSLWVSSKVFFDAIRFSTPFDTKIYVYAGGKEGTSMIPNVQRFKEAIAKRGLDASKVNFKLAIDPKGEHNEERWGKEFPKALEWLFF